MITTHFMTTSNSWLLTDSILRSKASAWCEVGFSHVFFDENDYGDGICSPLKGLAYGSFITTKIFLPRGICTWLLSLAPENKWDGSDHSFNLGRKMAIFILQPISIPDYRSANFRSLKVCQNGLFFRQKKIFSRLKSLSFYEWVLLIGAEDFLWKINDGGKWMAKEQSEPHRRHLGRT